MPRPRAIGEWVIVKLKERESSRVEIPDIAKDKAGPGAIFRVIDVGKKCRSGIKRGDQIIISASAATEFDYNGQHYFALPEGRIAVVIR